MLKKRQSQPREKRECQRCSALFTPKKRQVYCSPTCRRPPRRLRSRKCRFCKVKFKPSRKDAFYCSSRCRSRAGLARQKQKLEEQGMSKPSKPLEARQCVCGVHFDQTRYWQQYCSPECASRNRQQQLIERKARELSERGFYSSTGGNSSQGLRILLKENSVPD
jgi:hypothetical protein